MWSETPLLQVHRTRRPVRTALKRAVVGAADAYVVPGPSAARYLECLGAASDKIHLAPNAVDVAFWSQRPSGAGRRQERPLLLFVGRLVHGKGPDIAISAFSQSKLAERATLVVAGEGPERLALEKISGNRISFVGNQSREELRRLYHSADILLLPSRSDVWGLVLNEAAAAGVAAIASDAVGAAVDLIQDGENGLIVGAGKVDAFRAALDRLADDTGLMRQLGVAARKISSSHTPEACAAGLAAALG